MPDHPQLTNRLAKRRKAAGWTQGELAERISVSRKSVNTIENGIFIPSTVLALKLADAIDCSVHDLFALPGERKD